MGRLTYIRDLRAFGEQDLSLQFDGSFRRFSGRYRTANWLYIVHRDRLATAWPGNDTYRFSWEISRMRRWERYHRGRGRHTYLYSAEAHGGSRCPVTPALLAAGRARQAYVVLHEAWHATLRLAGIRMPYALEEATGRVVGVVGAVRFAERCGDRSLLREAKQQLHAWGCLARFVNRTHRRLDRFYRGSPNARERHREMRIIRQDARNLRGRVASVWEHEELTREMNNAFFFRYHDYTRLYPLALRVYRHHQSLRSTMRTFLRAGNLGAVDWLRRSAR